MIAKTFTFFKPHRLPYLFSRTLKDPLNKESLSISALESSSTNIQKFTQNFASSIFGSRIIYPFSSFTNPSPLQEEKVASPENQNCIQTEESEALIKKILEVKGIREERIVKCIQQKVSQELQQYMKQLKNASLSQQQKIKLIANQRQKLYVSISQNQELMRLIQFNENCRAMIMMRLEVLWNEKYDDLPLEGLIKMIEKLQDCKQLKNNYLKSMSVIFLTVEALKKCIQLPRINKNMLCQSRSFWENASYVTKCIKGEVQLRNKLQKIQNLFFRLMFSIQNNSNRYCFMKVQSQIQYLTAEVFKSFHEPNLYNDKSLCLLSNPPRVVFDEPFHQQFDRFMEIAVLVLFDKRLKKQDKLDKLQNINHMFEQLRSYEDTKLKQAYEKDKCSVLQIKKLKKKVIRMDKRINIINWIQNYVMQSVPK